jgi:hypothetical protein
MSIFNDKALKGVAEAVSKIVEAEKMAKKDHDQDGKIETGKAEYLGSRIRAAKLAGKLKEEEKIDEAFPTVADAKKRMDAGKTATGTVTKTKTGLVHKRDYEHDAGDDDHPEKKGRPSSYGARQNFKRSTRVNEQLSFTEMLHLYNESGVEVISKIVPQTVKFGDTEVELIDANIVNGAVGITVAEEVDNETFTKEVEAQKEKNAGRGKKAEVAKASVQAVKQEEVEQMDELFSEFDQLSEEQFDEFCSDFGIESQEQLDEISVDLAFKWLKSKKGGRKYRDEKSFKKLHDKFPDKETAKKHLDSEKRALKRAGAYPQPDYYSKKNTINKGKDVDGSTLRFRKTGGINFKTMKREEVEELDEAKEKKPEYDKNKVVNAVQAAMLKSRGNVIAGRAERAAARLAAKVKHGMKEDVEQIDEVSKKTLGSYIKAASHDVAAKGAFTRHFADKSRAETAAQRPDLARITMKKADKMQDAGMKRRANMAKAVDRLTKEDVEQIDERTLTSGETAKKEDYVKGMKKSVSGFKARYGDKAKSVMYATATKMAKKD